MIKAILLIAIFTLTACIKNDPDINLNETPTNDDSVVNIHSVDTKPIFSYGNKNGHQAIYKYINKNLQYPEMAKEAGAEGKVIISFIVSADGSVEMIELIKLTDHTLLNEEAFRVVAEMPDWIPAVQNGKNVSVRYSIPITFKLAE